MNHAPQHGMSRCALAALLASCLILAACGGGGCDAGKPAFANQPYDCPAEAAAPASAASR